MSGRCVGLRGGEYEDEQEWAPPWVRGAPLRFVMFTFCIPRPAGEAVAHSFKEGVGGPVFDRLAGLLRAKPLPDGDVLVQVGGADRAVLELWVTQHEDASWAPALRNALADGCNF